MNHRLRCARASLFLILSLGLLGDSAVTRARAPSNLLANGSFESGGTPSLTGWQPGNPELASTVSPGAPGGGDYALQLQADWAPTLGFVTQKIEGLKEGDIVELRAEVKALDADGGGSVSLIIGETPWSGRAKSAASFSQTWTTVSLADTVELAEGDSVWVRLSSFNTEVVPRIGFFDSISLSVLGTVPVTPITWGSLKVLRP